MDEEYSGKKRSYRLAEGSSPPRDDDPQYVAGNDREGYCRREKSLGLLCENFMRYCTSAINCPDGMISLDAVAQTLGVERRRIYDVTNILEALDMVSRKTKNAYMWHGTTHVPYTIKLLRDSALDDAGLRSQIRSEESLRGGASNTAFFGDLETQKAHGTPRLLQALAAAASSDTAGDAADAASDPHGGAAGPGKRRRLLGAGVSEEAGAAEDISRVAANAAAPYAPAAHSHCTSLEAVPLFGDALLSYLSSPPHWLYPLGLLAPAPGGNGRLAALSAAVLGHAFPPPPPALPLPPAAAGPPTSTVAVGPSSPSPTAALIDRAFNVAATWRQRAAVVAAGVAAALGEDYRPRLPVPLSGTATFTALGGLGATWNRLPAHRALLEPTAGAARAAPECGEGDGAAASMPSVDQLSRVPLYDPYPHVYAPPQQLLLRERHLLQQAAAAAAPPFTSLSSPLLLLPGWVPDEVKLECVVEEGGGGRGPPHHSSGSQHSAAGGSFTPTLRSLPLLSEVLACAAAGIPIGTSDSKRARRDRSLGVLTQRFLKLFLLDRKVLTLDYAAPLVITEEGEEEGAGAGGEEGAAAAPGASAGARGGRSGAGCGCGSSAKAREQLARMKGRRLYDIANVLVAVGLLDRVHVKRGSARRPAFRWRGPAYVAPLPGIVAPLWAVQKRTPSPLAVALLVKTMAAAAAAGGASYSGRGVAAAAQRGLLLAQQRRAGGPCAAAAAVGLEGAAGGGAGAFDEDFGAVGGGGGWGVVVRRGRGRGRGAGGAARGGRGRHPRGGHARRGQHGSEYDTSDESDGDYRGSPPQHLQRVVDARRSAAATAAAASSPASDEDEEGGGVWDEGGAGDDVVETAVVAPAQASTGRGRGRGVGGALPRGVGRPSAASSSFGTASAAAAPQQQSASTGVGSGGFGAYQRSYATNGNRRRAKAAEEAGERGLLLLQEGGGSVAARDDSGAFDLSCGSAGHGAPMAQIPAAAAVMIPDLCAMDEEEDEEEPPQPQRAGSRSASRNGGGSRSASRNGGGSASRSAARGSAARAAAAAVVSLSSAHAPAAAPHPQRHRLAGAHSSGSGGGGALYDLSAPASPAAAAAVLGPLRAVRAAPLAAPPPLGLGPLAVRPAPVAPAGDDDSAAAAGAGQPAGASAHLLLSVSGVAPGDDHPSFAMQLSAAALHHPTHNPHAARLQQQGGGGITDIFLPRDAAAGPREQHREQQQQMACDVEPMPLLVPPSSVSLSVMKPLRGGRTGAGGFLLLSHPRVAEPAAAAHAGAALQPSALARDLHVRFASASASSSSFAAAPSSAASKTPAPFHRRPSHFAALQHQDRAGAADAGAAAAASSRSDEAAADAALLLLQRQDTEDIARFLSGLGSGLTPQQSARSSAVEEEGAAAEEGNDCVCGAAAATHDGGDAKEEDGGSARSAAPAAASSRSSAATSGAPSAAVPGAVPAGAASSSSVAAFTSPSMFFSTAFDRSVNSTPSQSPPGSGNPQQLAQPQAAAHRVAEMPASLARKLVSQPRSRSRVSAAATLALEGSHRRAAAAAALAAADISPDSSAAAALGAAEAGGGAAAAASAAAAVSSPQELLRLLEGSPGGPFPASSPPGGGKQSRLSRGGCSGSNGESCASQQLSPAASSPASDMSMAALRSRGSALRREMGGGGGSAQPEGTDTSPLLLHAAAAAAALGASAATTRLSLSGSSSGGRGSNNYSVAGTSSCSSEGGAEPGSTQQLQQQQVLCLSVSECEASPQQLAAPAADSLVPAGKVSATATGENGYNRCALRAPVL